MKTDAFHAQGVIVTGASAGIGKALALQLAGQGAKVALAARRADRLEEIAAQCRALGAEALVIPTDVADELQCKALVEQTAAAFGRLDMLVCNAGLAATALFDDFPDLSLFRHTMDVNFYGAVSCTYYALPYLKQSKGRIVAISSLGGKAAIPYNTPYCASKYGMHGFYDSLRMELTQHGVSVTLICPWWVATEFHAAQMNKDGVPRGAARGKDMYTSRTMSAERCAEITLQAAYKRHREVLMGPGALAVWLKVLAPGFLDWMAVKVFLEPAIRRAKAAQVRKGT
ncbi:MAG: SDR family oxidoreductase [Anaerolineales bacterium]|jgi:short-subunit dehydrogenase|nr:SDR family oxidoreductase [Anaerolineales bacterium]